MYPTRWSSGKPASSVCPFCPQLCLKLRYLDATSFGLSKGTPPEGVELEPSQNYERPDSTPEALESEASWY